MEFASTNKKKSLTQRMFDWEVVNVLFALPIGDSREECAVKQTPALFQEKRTTLAGEICGTYESLRNEFLGRVCLAQDEITGRVVKRNGR